MGCNCKKPRNLEAVAIPTPTPEPVPQTPDELHIKELNDFYNNLDDYHIEQIKDIKTEH
jgi:hypothetical protein